jgi:hypothetical protein
MQPNASTTIDRDALNLARSIGLAESGDAGRPNYNAVGDNGMSKGAYQWYGDNFKTMAKAHGLDPNDFSPENQDKVAYRQVKQWKDEGLQPWEIAAKWNSGRTTTWKDHKGTTVINGKTVEYDTPAYVARVKQRYLELSGGAGQPVLAQKNTLLGDIGQSFKRAGSGIAEAYGKGVMGDINPASSLLQIGGAAARGVADVTGDLLMHTPVIGKGLEKAGEVLAPEIQKIAESPGGRGIAQAYGEFKQAHPEAAGNLEAVGNIATVVPIARGVQVAKRGAQGAARKALYGSPDALVEAVSPRLGPVGKAKAVAERGTVQRGLLGVKDIAPDPRMVDTANIIRQSVPEAERLLSQGRYLEGTEVLKSGARAIRDAYRAEAKTLGRGITFPIKEYVSALKKMDIPDTIVADRTMMNLRNMVIKRAEDIARKNGGSADKLVDILSDFDDMVKKRYPGLYRSEAMTPLREVVKGVRETTKEFTERAIPNLGLRERMLAVHKILDAVENVAKKGTSGATSELGKHILSDRLPKTRGLVRYLGDKALDAAGIGGMIKLLQ